MPRILVSHPHAASVANHAAAAFESEGQLAAYATGIAAVPGTYGERVLRLAGRTRMAALNRVVEGVPRARLRALWGVELAARVGAAVASHVSRRVNSYDTLFVVHDQAVSRMPWPRGLDAVYAYEDAARATFERARRGDLGRILDLPTPHWRASEAVWVGESTRWPGAMEAGPPLEPVWKKRRKDAELDAAQLIVVASGFARESLENAGCTKAVRVVPYGFPLQEFAAKERAPEGPFLVLAVGTQDLRKGTPYLLEAWRRAGLRNARLKLIGPMRLSGAFLWRYQGLFEHVPYLSRLELRREYQAADLLAFPTLGDGFGLVIQEAMCCGTPVLTTPCGGGPESMADGVEGWMVPPRDLDALVDRLRAGAADREKLVRMGACARRTAESYPWASAHERLSHAVATALGRTSS
jgi:glycosyltransferase involved in cell wall biosynthesis